MEVATRKERMPRKYLLGLSKCVEKDAILTAVESRAWKDIKERGLNLFVPERGGSYEVFNTRPLSDVVMQYCVQGVLFMPKLWLRYYSTMTDPWRVKFQEASKDRVVLSQTKNYNGKGRDMALVPRSFVLRGNVLDTDL